MGYSYHDFRTALAMRESSGNYRAVNSYDYLGAFQFGEGALIDLGFVNNDGRWWDNDYSGGWTGKFGIDSKAEFLASHTAQNKALKAWVGLLWGYLDAVGAGDYLGQTVGGIPITVSGLVAGAHLLGAGNVRDWLESGGTLDLTDAYGTPITEYIRLFSGYTLPVETGTATLDDLIGPTGALPHVAQARIDAVFDADHSVHLGSDEAGDRLIGDGHRDLIAGGAGRDTLKGAGGGDALIGGDGGDTLRGGRGSDLLHGQNGSDRLFGNAGRDRLYGGGGDDHLAGGGRNDRLVGGAGDDTLVGGRGADVFVFSDGFGQDRIADFDPTEGDRIRLAGVDGITGFHDLKTHHALDGPEGVVIETDTGDSLTLTGVSLDDLTADDFLF